MRAIVFSDSHGSIRALEEIAKMHEKDTDAFIFCGDGIEEMEVLSYMYREKQMIYVSGNCDWGSEVPDTKIIDLFGKKILVTHGHRFCVKNGLDILMSEAKKEGVDIVLYGHTHIPYTVTLDGIHYMNPGSSGKPKFGNPTYGILDVMENGIFMHISEAGFLNGQSEG